MEIENFYKKYELNEDDKKKIAQWTFARKKDRRSDLINAATKEVAKMIMYYCPDSHERNHAIIHMEMAMVNANLAMIEHEQQHNYGGNE